MSGPVIPVMRAHGNGELRKAQVNELNIRNISMSQYDQRRRQWRVITGEKGQSLLASSNTQDLWRFDAVITVNIDPKTGQGWWEAQNT